MLQSIREHTQGWIAGTIISVIILTFALWGIHSYFVGGANNTVVAKVNDVEITREQLTVAYERLRRQVQAQNGSNTFLNTKNDSILKDRALQALIDIEVLKQASTQEGFQVSDRQIDNYLQSMPEFQIDGRFSLERFQEALSSTLLSTSEFLDLIRTSLLIDQPKLGIIFSSFALLDETAYSIALVNQEREIEYIQIPQQYFLSKAPVISPDKIKAYYDKNQSDFLTPEQVTVEYIELSMKDLTAKVNPTDLILKNFYNENINTYTQPMSWKLIAMEIPLSSNATAEDVAKVKKKVDGIAQAIAQGEDFAKISREHTQILNGEDWMTLSQVPADLQKSVAALKAGEISKPIQTNQGIVIIKAVEIKEPKIETFENVKDKVKEAYVRQHAEEKFAELREQLADLTYEHPDSLQFASKTMGLPIKTSELFTKDKPGKDISQYKKVRDAAFSNDVLTVQNNSDVIQLTPETVVTIRVKSHIASTLLPLASISKQIEDKLKSEEAETQGIQFAENFKNKLMTGQDSEILAKNYGFVWNKAGYLGRYSSKVDSAILDAAFSLPNPATIKKNTVFGIARLPNGYAIIALKAVKEGRMSDQKQSAVFAEQVQNSEGLLEYELYKQSETKKADIEIL